MTDSFSNLSVVKLQPKLGFWFLLGSSLPPVYAQEKKEKKVKKGKYIIFPLNSSQQKWAVRPLDKMSTWCEMSSRAQEAFIIYPSPLYPFKMFVKQILCFVPAPVTFCALECEEKLDKTPGRHLEKEGTFKACSVLKDEAWNPFLYLQLAWKSSIITIKHTLKLSTLQQKSKLPALHSENCPQSESVKKLTLAHIAWTDLR